MDYVTFEIKGHVAIVSIQRNGALNALNSQLYLEISQIFDSIEQMPELYAVVLTGSSQVNKKGKEVQFFIAGADVAQMANMTVAESKDFVILASGVCEKVHNFKRPVIAAVNGYCFGGGCELALACDIRLASANAIFGLPEVGLGIIPGSGGTQRLPRLIGEGRAKEMLFTGRSNFSAEYAEQVGLVNHVYTTVEELNAAALALAEEIAAQAPVAIAQLKESVNVGMQMDMKSALQYEINCLAYCFSTQDQKEAMYAFANKLPKPPFQNE